MTPSTPTFKAVDLVVGQTYLVVKPFKDYDEMTHPAGESWSFLEKHFLPYEDGLTLVVNFNGQKIFMRLQWRSETQADIIDHFSDFVTAV
jgi:hypothetical protein